MALTPERILELWENYSPTQGIESFARSVEAEVRKDALEEAAKVCDNLTSEWTPEECAEKIRARLKEIAP